MKYCSSLIALALLALVFLGCSKNTQEKMLQSQFDQFQADSGSPAISVFRENRLAAVSFLARKMKSNNSAVRVKAVNALRYMGHSFTDSDIGVAALCGALNDPDDEVRSIAEGALGDAGQKAKAAVPSLIKCISGGTDINGVWALGRIGPDAKDALPILESKMRQETGRERVYAAGAVWAIGGENAEAAAVVKKALEDPDPHVRIDAKNVLVESPEISKH